MAPSAVRSQNFVSTTPKRDPFADSEHYPLNSPTWRDPISVDLKRCKKDLNEAGTKIFGSVTQFDVVAVNYFKERDAITSQFSTARVCDEGGLRSVLSSCNSGIPLYLEPGPDRAYADHSPPDDDSSSNSSFVQVLPADVEKRIDRTAVGQHVEPLTLVGQHMFFFLKPKYSFGALLISLEIQRKLLTALNVFPAFLDILHLFGDKCDEMNEDYAVYQQEITWERDKYMNATKTPEAFEICYNFRYIDQAVKGQGESFTWRRKKMGFYSKYVPATKTSTWISVLAPRECVPRLKDVFTSDPMHPRERRHDLDIHILFMQIATRSWLPYINALDDDLRKMDKRAFLWRPKPGNLILKAHKDSELELVDTQRVQKFKIELLTMIHALEVNQANIASLRRGIESFRRKTNVYITDDQYKQYDEDLEDLHILLSQHKVRVSNLLQRAESLFALIITIIPYNYARHENTLMLQLSEKAAVYAKSMKVITVVCMLYLPPSVVASIFGMGFSDPTWSTSVTWIVFTAITIGLAMLSILVWLWWEKKCAKE